MARNRIVRLLAIVSLISIVLIFAGIVFKGDLKRRWFEPTKSNVQQGVTEQTNQQDIQIVGQNLGIPWEIAFLPDGDILVTERAGTLKRIGRNNQTYNVEGVRHTSEGGLLGLALHPDFGRNHLLYVYLTASNGSGLINRVERYRYDDDLLSERTPIITDIPGAANHDGGRLAFGPDRLLYITTGDAGNEAAAQDKNSLAGKILRLKDDGSLPADNPFGSAIYSYGHRNPQGLAWDGKGQLWSSEHGRSGLRSGYDEINLIISGGNYGWPTIEGDQAAVGMISPVAHSGSAETWAPASLAFFRGSLYFGGLRGESLYQAKISDDNKLSLISHLSEKFGRVRAVAVGPGNQLYISTSNTDGRGSPNDGDDKILRLESSLFNL